MKDPKSSNAEAQRAIRNLPARPPLKKPSRSSGVLGRIGRGLAEPYVKVGKALRKAGKYDLKNLRKK